MMFRFLIFFIFFTQLSQLSGQPDSRFRPFDWVLYRGAGSISSITEGYTFVYIGTEMGGLKRFNLYSNNFEECVGAILESIPESIPEAARSLPEASRSFQKLREAFQTLQGFLELS